MTNLDSRNPRGLSMVAPGSASESLSRMEQRKDWRAISPAFRQNKTTVDWFDLGRQGRKLRRQHDLDPEQSRGFCPSETPGDVIGPKSCGLNADRVFRRHNYSDRWHTRASAEFSVHTTTCLLSDSSRSRNLWLCEH